ncbi:hypothetical protein D6D06_01504 [Aureobasidium pullulans]|nr:hypothetical protein D6D06_01504 [Aureobasidium pullulans]
MPGSLGVGRKKEEVSTVLQDESNTQKFFYVFRSSFRIYTSSQYGLQSTTIQFSGVDVTIARKPIRAWKEASLIDGRCRQPNSTQLPR